MACIRRLASAWLGTAAWVAAYFVLLALPAFAESASKRSSQITFAMGWEPISFYPLRALDSASYYAQTLVYEGLLKYDSRLEVAPALAESFQISADFLTYTFKLRASAKFSDGQPVTIDDVLKSINWAMAPTSPYQADYADIRSVERADERTVVLKLSQPSAPLLSRLVELRIMPARLLAAPDHGRDELSRHPCGSGPFILKSWESGSELVFEPNPYYWGKHPAYERLVWKVVPDHSLLALALKNGEVDVAQCEARDWAFFLRKPPGKELTLERFPGSRTIYLGFNLTKPPFDRLSVRKAIAMSVNRKALVDTLFGGYATLASGDFAEASWAADRAARQWPYDPREAARLLEAEGQPLAFSIMTVKEYESVASALATDLHKVGVKAEVSLVEFSTLRQRYLKKGLFQTVVWSRSVGPDPECSLVWHTGGPLNLYKFSNQRVDRLLELGRRSHDRQERAKIYVEIQKILSAELPWVFLFHPDLLLAHSPQITNVKEPGQETTGLPWDNPLFNAADWQRQ